MVLGDEQKGRESTRPVGKEEQVTVADHKRMNNDL